MPAGFPFLEAASQGTRRIGILQTTPRHIVSIFSWLPPTIPLR